MRRIVCLLLGLGFLTGSVAGSRPDARAEDQKKEDRGTVVEIDGLKSRTPADWKEEQPPAKFRKTRLKQFRVPRAEGDEMDALLTIIHLQGQGGGVEQNIQRWKAQFRPPRGKAIDDVTRVEKFKVGDVPVVYVDVQGTYLPPPFEGGEPRPNHRLLAVYFDSKNGPYFFRLLGPIRTVERHKKGFEEWVKGFR